MKNKQRQIFLTFIALILFFGWFGLLLWQAEKYHKGEPIKVFVSRSRFGHDVKPYRPSVISSPSSTFSRRPMETVVNLNNSVAPALSTDVNQQSYSPQRSLSAVSYRLSAVSSQQSVHSYVSGGGQMFGGSVSRQSATAVPQTTVGLSSSYSAMLASNTITTSASLLRGGVTTFDSDGGLAMPIRRGPTPGDPEEDELPVDGARGATPAIAFLSILAIGYGVTRRHSLKEQ